MKEFEVIKSENLNLLLEGEFQIVESNDLFDLFGGGLPGCTGCAGCPECPKCGLRCK